ncbi:uncharacterized protein N7459_007316 [Penicillium hispanicum]|uniref:uncharacterized protein n=1 Tax=Penicillium hispanicum TaxID=1080232 RepID=UPI002541CA61|nr:uncharacterized protein N7459_007316 [Penicillium hispanicum]KAJ5578352.1 hypothetical protein N7459_007316 [Penicillium hispanicum]
MHSTYATLFLLSTPIYATTTARVWTHFFPSCPGEPFSDLSTYENYEETAPSQVVPVGSCANIGVPSYEHNLVSAISVDGELISNEPGHPFPPEDGPSCNVTLHEVPGCVDPPLITKPLHDGVEVSKCESRRFAAYSEVWVKLVCEDQAEESLEDQKEDIPRIDETASIQHSNNVQTPGSNSNSWHMAQTSQNEREPEQEGRVNNDGHAQSQQIVQNILQLLNQKKNGTNLVTGKHNATGHHLHATLKNNGTAPANRTVSRRKLSVLRNRPTRLY